MITEEEFKTLKAEVDTLQIQANEKQKPWLSRPSNVISLFALVFSFGTTSFSLWKGHKEEEAANRKDVRELILRVTRLPIESLELNQKFSTQGPDMSSLLTQEQLVLANQAAEKIDLFPDSFTSTEYFAVAWALAGINNPTHVKRFFERAVTLATTANDYVVATRALAHHLFTLGKVDEGRALYSKAILETWLKFPETEKIYRQGLVIQTYLNLASSENSIGNKKRALNAIGDAQAAVEDMPDPDWKLYWQNQASNMLEYVKKFDKSESPQSAAPIP
jgi:tetratricopeptide (TPR) repeat protein